MNLIIVPFMSAILGWLVAWLFVKVIFLSWTGGLKNRISSIEMEKIFNQETSLTQFEKTLPIIDKQLDHFFKQKLGEKMPMISMFIGDKTVAELKSVFIEELQLLFPTLVLQFMNDFKLNFAENLSNKWRPILETALLKATLKYRIFAAVIGFIWGIITLMLTHLL